MVGEFQVRVDTFFDNISNDIKTLGKAHIFNMFCLNSLDNQCCTSYMRNVSYYTWQEFKCTTCSNKLFLYNYLSHVNKPNTILCFIAVKITTQLLVFTGYLIMEWCGGPDPFDAKF